MEDKVILMKIWVLMTVLLLSFFFSTPAQAWDREFSGRVIDADTKEPITNAVVVAVWTKSASTLSGSDSKLHDVKETLTDKDGSWKIVGPKGDPGSIFYGIVRIFLIHIVDPPTFIVFKPGYCAWRNGYGIATCNGKMKTYGEIDNKSIGEVVELPRLTNREDRRINHPSPVHKDGDIGFYKKQRTYLTMIDEELRYLGLPEYKFFKEGKDEEK